MHFAQKPVSKTWLEAQSSRFEGAECRLRKAAHAPAINLRGWEGTAPAACRVTAVQHSLVVVCLSRSGCVMAARDEVADVGEQG